MEGAAIQSDDTVERGPRWVLAAAGLLIAIFATLSQVTAWNLPDDIDEQAYVVVGRLNLEGHDWAGELAAHIGPVSLYFNQLGLVGVPTDELTPNPTQHHFGRARTGLLIPALLAAVLVFVWSRRLFGPLGGLCSLAAFCLNPIVSGYAGLANVDMTHAATTTLAVFITWRLAVAPRPALLAAVGAAFALALATKFLAILIAPVLGVVVLMRAGPAFGGGGGPGARIARTALGVLVFGAAMILTLHAAYQFRGGFSPIDPDAYDSARFARLAAIPGVNLAMALIPWPMVRGIDLLSVYDAGEPSVYLNGVFGTGHWDYYLWCWLTKTPETILLAVIAGVAVCAPRLRRADLDERWALCLMAVCVALPLFALSTVIKRRVGIRYVMQLMPMLCVMGGALAPALLARARDRSARRALAALAALAIAFTLFETASAAPNSIAYFNRTSGGQSEAWRRFVDSNADFGQYRERGVEILRERGHEFTALRGQEGPRFGRVAVYLTALSVDPALRGGGPHWTDGIDAIDHAGAAWWLFDVTPEAMEAVVAEDDSIRRREAIAEAYLAAGDLAQAGRHIAAIPSSEPSLVREAMAFLEAKQAGTADFEAGLALANRALEAGRASLVEHLLGAPDFPPSTARTWLLARSLEERRRIDEAIALVRSTPNLSTDPVNVLFLSFLLRRSGRVEEALRMLDEHDSLLAGDPAADRLRADLERARESRGFVDEL